MLVSDMVDICRNRYLLGGAIEQRNKLAAAYTAGQTTLAFQYDLRGIAAGCRIAVGGNTFYVWAVDTSSNTATVQGGESGSTDANADLGAIVQVNPRYTQDNIFDAINEEILDLGSPQTGLYQIQRTTVVYNPSRVGYDLPGVTDITQIVEVRVDQPDQFMRTPRLDSHMYSLERNYSTTDNSSGFSIKIKGGGWPGRNVNILYRAPFTPYTSTSVDALTSGLTSSMLDIPSLGAAIRLLSGREVRRNQIEAQGDTRRAEEVGPGAQAASWRGIAALRQARISAEVAKLSAANPSRMW
jgi:hypothetical protein